MSWRSQAFLRFLILLFCPVVMSFLILFMMRGKHIGSSGHEGHDQAEHNADADRIAPPGEEIQRLTHRQSHG